MTLAELGARLREAREGREMTVADVADRLKIPTRILQGIEEGSDRVPRTVYAHHFIKEYALLLGFAQDEVAEWLRNLEGFENISRPVIADTTTYTSVKPSMLPVIIGAVLKLVLVVALAFGAYMAYVHFFAARDYETSSAVSESSGTSVPTWGTAAPTPVPAPAPAPVEQAGSVEQRAVVQQEAVGEDPAASSAATATGAEQTPSGPVSSAASDGQNGVSSAVEQPALPSAEEPASAAVGTEPEQPAAAVLPDGLHQVEVIADTGDCWMGFEPDGKKQQRTLRKGDTFSMTFRDSLVIRLGNARAVRIIYDGRELERSSSHRVVTMNFPSDVR